MKNETVVVKARITEKLTKEVCSSKSKILVDVVSKCVNHRKLEKAVKDDVEFGLYGKE